MKREKLAATIRLMESESAQVGGLRGFLLREVVGEEHDICARFMCEMKSERNFLLRIGF
jgi:hypothetical protein